MKAGDTFLATQGPYRHLRVILSDPDVDPDHVLIVDLTTWEDGKDPSCIIKGGEHPWVTHDTCVDYVYGKIVGRDVIHAAQDKGLLTFREPLSAALLARIRAAAARSDKLTVGGKNLLRRQGLIP